MRSFAASIILPLYVLLCIVLGGSTQSLLGSLILQLVGIGVLGWAVLTQPRGALPPPARFLAIVALLSLLLFALHLVPLPAAIWSALPGREVLAGGFDLLGQRRPAIPLSVTPHHTLATLPTLVPALAVLAAMLLRSSFKTEWLTAALLLGTFAAVLLGALQVGSADPQASGWYFYRHSNFGSATGFFANSNHMGALLLVSVPFLVALVRRLRERSSSARAGSAGLILALAGLLVLGVGMMLNGSLAVLLLGLPVLAMSAAMLKPQRMALRRQAVLAAGISLAVVLAVLLTPFGARLVGEGSASLGGRGRMWSTTAQAIADFAPLGSGIGSFQEVYSLFEQPAAVTGTVVNHAHNDYLEILLETGVPGLILLLLFLWWWVPRAAMMWRPHAADAFGQAAAIASGTLLLHSIVDYPLRMPALNAIFAACLAIMAMPRRQRPGEAEDLWPTRHLRI